MFKFFKKRAEEEPLEILKKQTGWFCDLEQLITNCKQEVLKYTKLLEDFTDNYLPIRDKCIETIRKNGLGRYPLKDVLEVKAFGDDTVELIIYGIKEDYWDGKQILVPDGKLLDETIQLNTLKLLNTEFDTPYDNTTEFADILNKVERLEDPIKVFEGKIRELYMKIGIFLDKKKVFDKHCFRITEIMEEINDKGCTESTFGAG